MYCCRDEDWGFQLYQSDPSGNYGGWKATAIGANKQAAQNLLKQDYEEDITLEKAIKLVIKVSLSRDVLLLVVYLLRTIKLVLRLTPRCYKLLTFRAYCCSEGHQARHQGTYT